MPGKLVRLLIIITTLFLLYSIAWFSTLTSLSYYINKKYSNQYINVTSSEDNDKYFIRFSMAKPYGFPFKLGLKVVAWSEENLTSKIEFNSPIYIGYNLLEQSLFVSFPKEATARYKPIESGFGVKFSNEYSSITVKLPLSFELFKIISQQKDFFQIVNLIKTIELKSAQTKIFDLIDSQKLYEEEYTNIYLSFDKSKYYNNLQDFLENIPPKVNITYSTEIKESNLENRRVPSSLLLYRFAWPAAFKLHADFYVKINSSNFIDILKDLEIRVNSVNFSGSTHESVSSLLYKGKMNSGASNDITLKIDSHIKLKNGFIDDLLNKLLNFTNQYTYITKMLKKNTNDEKLVEDIKFIIANKDKFNFTHLEDRLYSLVFDTSLSTISNNLIRIRINDLSLFSGNSSFRLTNESELNPLKTFFSRGLLACSNSYKVIEVLGSYFYNLEKFKNLSDETKEVYIESLQNFLKAISDHPESNSNDISFEYELDFTNLDKMQIGTIKEINKIIPLYYLSLYKSAAKKIKPGDNTIKRMKELIPDFNDKQKLLEQFMVAPFQTIDEDKWREVTEE